LISGKILKKEETIFVNYLMKLKWLKTKIFSGFKAILKTVNSILRFIYNYFLFFIEASSPFKRKILAFGIVVIFSLAILATADYQKDSIAQSLPDCAELDDATSPQAGQNCLYYGLPLCTVFNSDSDRRKICADLIDLPLCSQIVNNPRPGKNCVELCSNSAYDNPDPNASPAKVRGSDYAVFNRDCIRFCGEAEPDLGVLEVQGESCFQRRCHQLESSVVPLPEQNCDLMKCNLLTPDELNKPKFDDSVKKYCDGENLKCYNFTANQLPFIRLRKDNQMCQIHNCKPTSSACTFLDETDNIASQGADYVAVYERFINAGFPIASNAICSPVTCLPVVKTQYRCVNSVQLVTGDDSLDVNRNSNCDSSGDGSVCNANYCYRTVDCNLSANQTRSECLSGVSNSVGDGTFIDPFDSWFYRPKPAGKSTNGSGVMRSFDVGRMCYHGSQMEANGWGQRLEQDFGLFTIDLGWWHDFLIEESRSPGLCGAASNNLRGGGYMYLCGTDFSLYNLPDEDTSYYSGYVRTVFSNNSAIHKIRVCTRFRNLLSLGACGKRECGISATGFMGITINYCGGDICYDLEVDESDPYKCLMNDSYARNTNISGCSKTVDSFIRARAVQYDDKICAFLDNKGQLAYNGMFMNGKESLDDGVTCVNDISGAANSSGCNGYNSNDYESDADKFRAISKIRYIKNNQPASEYYIDAAGKTVYLKGYLDANGKFYKEQECPKITLRIAPPDLYNLANLQNSEKLFIPPLYIRSAIDIKGGVDIVPQGNEDYGKTDFHYPEIRIQFGNVTSKMSLGIGEINGDAGLSSSINLDPASPAYQTLSTDLRGRTYEAEVFVKKEFSLTDHKPIFCAYRKIKDVNGLYVQPFRIGCVDRKEPEIDNKRERLALSSLPARKVLTSLDSSSTYDNSAINLKYLASFGTNGIDNKCSVDDDCSGLVSISNPQYSTPNCDQSLEAYEICARREECSQIYVECVINEIAYSNALNLGENTSSFDGMRRKCNNNLLSFCKEKKGLPSSSPYNIYNFDEAGSSVSIDPNIYGWFNEICIASGFEAGLKNVVAHSLPNSVLGKCFVDPASPYLTDSNPDTNCDEGGFAPNCLCLEAPDGYITQNGQEVRKQTRREAGLCVDMPKPKLCAPIDYNPNPNQVNVSDPEYVYQSLGNSVYNDATGVHSSHKYRSSGKSSPNPIPLAGHAEFSASYFGINGVRGECKGFWTYQKASTGATLYPKMDCVNDNGDAVWNASSLVNPCVRYSCPAINTFGPDRVGNYQGNYADAENGEQKGLFHGFALWNSFEKTNDFLESSTASACIAGFKPNGSSPVIQNDEIFSYSGGSLPTRNCDQLGSWSSSSNSCQRIQCPAVSPPIPSSASDISAWNQWFKSGGAEFPAINASRSSTRTQTESISYGACNNSLGFFQSPGGSPPSRECDYLGNWKEVQNPCVSSCEAILEDDEARSLNNGFSKWSAAQGAVGSSGVEGAFQGCVGGYVPYPYPPTVDLYGNPVANASDINRALDSANGETLLPRRLCRTGTTSQGVQVSVWGNVVNACVNSCPGADYDNRIGAGRTAHSTSNGSIVVDWQSTPLGTYQFVNNWLGQEAHFDAGYFHPNRTNGFYLLRRFCGYDGKWSDPEPSCALNNGLLGNARYILPNAASGYENSISTANNSSLVVDGACYTNYWTTNDGQGALPQRSCVFKDASQNIDEVYLDFANSTVDCEKMGCPPRTSSIIGNAVFDEVVNYSPSGTQIQGSCAPTYHFDGVPPNMTCQSDGNWGPVQNSESCKAGCNVPAGGIYLANGDTQGMRYWWGSFTLRHGTSILFSVVDLSDSGSWWCRSATKYIACNNGELTSLLYDSGNFYWWGNCKIPMSYDPQTNQYDVQIKAVSSVYPSSKLNYLDHHGEPQILNIGYEAQNGAFNAVIEY
jgi:hypothetical protein